MANNPQSRKYVPNPITEHSLQHVQAFVLEYIPHDWTSTYQHSLKHAGTPPLQYQL